MRKNDMNSIEIIGTIGKLERRVVNDRKCAVLRVAVDSEYLNENQEKICGTTWFVVRVFDTACTSIDELSVGQQIRVRGRLRITKTYDTDGAEHSVPE